MQSIGIVYTVGDSHNAQEAKELIIGNWRGGWPAPRSLTAQIGLGF